MINEQNGAPRPFVMLLAVIAIVCAFTLTTGYLYPAISLRIISLEGDIWINGVQNGSSGIGVIVGSLAMPFVSTYFGSWNVVFFSLLATSFLLVFCGFITDPIYYIAIRFFLGVAVSSLFVVSETWINQLAPEADRGRIIAIYASVMSGTFGIGPLLIPLIGYKTLFPWMVMGAVLLILAIPLLTIRNHAPNVERIPIRKMLHTLKRIPVILYAILTFGFVDGAFLGLWPVYGTYHGLSDSNVSYLLVSFLLGTCLFQLPIGYLADKSSNRLMLKWTSSLTIIITLTLPLIDLNGWYIWLHLILLGGFSFGIYTLAMAMIGKHLKGGELMAATAAFGISWGMGAAYGGTLTGWAMEQYSVNALPLMVAFIYTVLLLCLFLFEPIRKG